MKSRVSKESPFKGQGPWCRTKAQARNQVRLTLPLVAGKELGVAYKRTCGGLSTLGACYLEGLIILPKWLHSTSRGYPHGAIQLFAMDQK